MKVLYVVRDNEIKLQIPESFVVIKPNGTIWGTTNSPILSISDPNEKKRITELCKKKKYSDIPTEHFIKMGDNPNGTWAGWKEDFKNHPLNLKIAEEERARKKIEARTVSIYLSSRGWGDYSNVTWIGDITKPDQDIISECQTLLKNGTDVDNPNQTPEEIQKHITKARQIWIDKQSPSKETIKHSPGYCYSCESYCYGDCGDYHPELTHDLITRKFKNTTNETNSGIQD